MAAIAGYEVRLGSHRHVLSSSGSTYISSKCVPSKIREGWTLHGDLDSLNRNGHCTRRSERGKRERNMDTPF